jgi:hypothetical protein
MKSNCSKLLCNKKVLDHRFKWLTVENYFHNSLSYILKSKSNIHIFQNFSILPSLNNLKVFVGGYRSDDHKHFSTLNQLHPILLSISA